MISTSVLLCVYHRIIWPFINFRWNLRWSHYWMHWITLLFHRIWRVYEFWYIVERAFFAANIYVFLICFVIHVQTTKLISILFEVLQWLHIFYLLSYVFLIHNNLHFLTSFNLWWRDVSCKEKNCHSCAFYRKFKLMVSFYFPGDDILCTTN